MLPPNSKRNKLSTLKTIKKGKYGLNTRTAFNYGNHFDKKYDKGYKYELPYEKNEDIVVSQGYNGSLSHKNKNQLDFKMPVKKKF